jgi:putative nucleotidyltransferase with HDIG domain
MSHSTLNQLARQEKMRREILHKSDLIPPLPDLVVRLLGLLNKQNTEPADLENLLQNDQVLVAKMLAMVNSPFYGLNRPIRTIKEAVMVLGFRGVRSLVLATSTAKFLQRDFTVYGHEPKGLWLHAVCVAAGARRVARACRMSADEAELVFVGGLLHDIGKLLLVSYLAEVGLTAPLAGDSTERERECLGLDHTEAGGMVTARWNLAHEIQEVVAAHHGDESAATNARIAIVRIADAVANERGIGYRPGLAPSAQIRTHDLQAVGVDDAAWRALRDDVVVTMDEALAALGSLCA